MEIPKKLKKQIEKASKLEWAISGNDSAEQQAFRDGAHYLYNEGYRFNELEMIDFANWYINRRQMEYMTPSEGFNRWVKEREK